MSSSEPDRGSTEAHERRLLSRVADGDRRAFEQLYFAYQPRLMRFVARMVRCENSAEEVVNDVMLVLWRSASRFAGRSRVSTWVFGIAYRTALRALRRRRLRRLISFPGDALQEVSVEGGYALHVEQQWLRRGFDSLSAPQRAVVELCYFGGYGYAEIAQIVGCPENTVKTRMFHARKKLKLALPALAGAGDNDQTADAHE